MKIPFFAYWEILSSYLLEKKVQFVTLTLLLFTGIGLQIYSPQFIKKLIDAAGEGAADSLLIYYAVVFIVISIVQQIITVLSRLMGEVIAWRATNGLRRDLTSHCINLDMGFHTETSPGEMIERIDGDIGHLSNFFSQIVVLVLGNIILLLGILTVLFLEDYRIGIAFTLFTSSTVFILFKVRNIAVPVNKARREEESKLFGYLEERLAGTEDIRSSGAVEHVINGLYTITAKINKLQIRQHNLFTVIRVISGLCMISSLIISTILGYYLFNAGILTLGTVYLLFHYSRSIARPIRILTHQIQDLQNVKAAVERISDLKNVVSKIQKGSEVFYSDRAASLDFNNITFSYNKNDKVLKNLDFKLEAGKVLGVLGRTGSGKSTLARLIFRFYNTDEGEILINNRNIAGYTLKSLREKIAYVTQDVQLFQASIKDNLTLFSDEIADEVILKLIDDLNLGEWFESLPDGLETMLKSGGEGLSAGEAQLLAFIRAFLKDPDLIIMDEASSRLDPATEKLIERVVDRLLQNRTAIIIAHRLGTIERADTILILDQGEQKEYGDRMKLAADKESELSRLMEAGLEEVLV